MDILDIHNECTINFEILKKVRKMLMRKKAEYAKTSNERTENENLAIVHGRKD